MLIYVEDPLHLPRLFLCCSCAYSIALTLLVLDELHFVLTVLAATLSTFYTWALLRELHYLFLQAIRNEQEKP